MGLGFALIGLGVLAGGPGGGGILQRNPDHLDWTGAWTFGGVTPIVASAFFMVVRYMLVGTKIFVKV